MTTLYQIKKTVAGKSTVEGTPKVLDKAQADLAAIASYMQRQGAQIVLSSPDSFTMVLARIVSRYSIVPTT
jgi:hypothetical protein